MRSARVPPVRTECQTVSKLTHRQHPYLLSAILALGGTHLSRLLPESNYATEAMVDRGRAIEGLNQALNKTNRTFGESDAMLAVCYALTFQSSYMDDGLQDFITMVRGCALVTGKVKSDGVPTAFNIENDTHYRIMSRRLHQLPHIDSDILVEAVLALNDVRHLLEHPIDLDFHAAILNTIGALQISSAEGYIQFTLIYRFFYAMSHEDFAYFINSHNLAIQLLLAYFLATQFIMAPLAQYEWPDHAPKVGAEVLLGTIQWAEKIFEKISPLWESYLEWPKKIVRIVRAEISNQNATGGVLRPKSRLCE